MYAQLARLERRFLELEALLASPDIAGQPHEFRKLSKERAELQDSVALYRQWKSLNQQMEDAQALMDDPDPGIKAMAQAERDSLKDTLETLNHQLAICLLPKDPNDGRNILLEIRAGAGGDEASLFAGELLRMYLRYCERNRWKAEILSQSENELGGVKEVVVLIQGDRVYSRLKFESGVHRVQRVPATESQGRVHTSTVTVAILPEAEDVEVTIDDTELRIDTYRSGGAGGQHVNRTDSAVRITHLPTGLVVCCQDERSQLKNKARAMKILQSKLLERAQEEQDKQLAQDRRQLVGRGDRSERIRTYNFPQSRMTDHRIGFTTHELDALMEGDINGLLDRLQAFAQTEALKAQGMGDE